MLSPFEEQLQQIHAAHDRCSPLRWVHNHPTATRVAQAAGAALGAVALGALLTLSLPLPAAIAVGVVGALLSLAALISWLFLHYVTGKAVDPSVHVYQERSCEGGRLYYRGDLPVLELSGNQPYGYGHAHGYLLGSAIHGLLGHVELALHTVMGLPRAEQLPSVMQQLRDKTPAEYRLEMQGLAAGFNQWADEEGVSCRVTLDEVLLLHWLPDIKHFAPDEVEEALVACTTLVYDGVIGRNMDFCPFGDAGGKSVLIVWKDQGIAVLGVPGMIGVVTGWNRWSVVAAMNVCPGHTTAVQGMPSIFLNRYILERAVSATVALHKPWPDPLGPYHLTLADLQGGGGCISFHQGGEGHYRRPVPEGRPLEVLNWRQPESTGGFFDSEGRHRLITRIFDEAQRHPTHPDLMEHVLQMPGINAWMTLHSLIFRNGQVTLRWGNGFAATAPATTLEMGEVFSLHASVLDGARAAL